MLNNFHLISKLPFLAKVLEKVVVGQLIDRLNDKGIFDKFQSGFRAGHSTGTALLRVLDDLLLAADHGLTSVLWLLDLTAAFHTVDQREFFVSIGDFKSFSSHFSYGVPQGSVLGLLLFSVYMLAC